MATKKTTGVKAPKTNEKQVAENTSVTQATERPAFKVPFITARIDRLSDNPESKIKANASVTIGNHFAAHGFKVYDGGDKGLQVLYPGHKGTDGKFYEDFHPVTKEAREAINGYVLDAYEQKIEQTQSDEQSEDDLDDDEEPAFEQTMQVLLLTNQ